MTCEPLQMGDRMVIVCTRGAGRGGGRVPRCRWCSSPGERQCDAVLPSGRTCDVNACRKHSTSVGPDRDHCRAHTQPAAPDPRPGFCQGNVEGGCPNRQTWHYVGLNLVMNLCEPCAEITREYVERVGVKIGKKLTTSKLWFTRLPREEDPIAQPTT